MSGRCFYCLFGLHFGLWNEKLVPIAIQIALNHYRMMIFLKDIDKLTNNLLFGPTVQLGHALKTFLREIIYAISHCL